MVNFMLDLCDVNKDTGTRHIHDVLVFLLLTVNTLNMLI